jgi:putative selenium metabolism hydrolase
VIEAGESALATEQLVALCRALVRAPSPPGREDPSAEVLADELRRLGFRDVRTDRYGSVAGTIGGADGPAILLDGHLDTIELVDPNAWTHDPHGADLEDGAIHGLGVVDMKAGLAAQVYGAARAAREGRLPGPVHVTGTVGEEIIEGPALGAWLDELHPALVLIGEPTDLRLHVGQRGRAEVVLETFGRPAHSAHAWHGRNAVYDLIAAVPRLRAAPLPTHEFLEPAVIELIDVISDPYPSLSNVPHYARATFDRRTLPGEDAAAVLGALEAALAPLKADDADFDARVSLADGSVDCYTGQRLSATKFAPAWFTPPDSPIVQTATAALREVGLDRPIGAYRSCTNGSAAGGLRGIPTLGFGPAPNELAHRPNEWVALEDLELAARGYAALCARLSALVAER